MSKGKTDTEKRVVMTSRKMGNLLLRLVQHQTSFAVKRGSGHIHQGFCAGTKDIDSVHRYRKPCWKDDVVKVPAVQDSQGMCLGHMVCDPFSAGIEYAATSHKGEIAFSWKKASEFPV